MKIVGGKFWSRIFFVGVPPPPPAQGWRSSSEAFCPPPPKQTPWRRPLVGSNTNKAIVWEVHLCLGLLFHHDQIRPVAYWGGGGGAGSSWVRTPRPPPPPTKMSTSLYLPYGKMYISRCTGSIHEQWRPDEDFSSNVFHHFAKHNPQPPSPFFGGFLGVLLWWTLRNNPWKIE